MWFLEPVFLTIHRFSRVSPKPAAPRAAGLESAAGAACSGFAAECEERLGGSLDWTQLWTQTLDYGLQLNGTGHHECQRKPSKLLYKTTTGYCSI